MPHWDPFWPLDESNMADEEVIVFSSVPVDENPRKTPPRRERSRGLTLDDIKYDKVDWPGWQNRPWDLSILQEQKRRMLPTPPEETSYNGMAPICNLDCPWIGPSSLADTILQTSKRKLLAISPRSIQINRLHTLAVHSQLPAKINNDPYLHSAIIPMPIPRQTPVAVTPPSIQTLQCHANIS